MTYESGQMYVVDATDGLGQIEDGSVDLIITDPAYDSLEKWRAMGTTTRLKKSKSSSNAWFPTVPPGYFKTFFAECYRVLKKNTHIYVFCDPETMFHIQPMLIEAGFDMKKPLIWHKVGKPIDLPMGMVPDNAIVRRPGGPGMGYPYRSCYEVIMFAQKGKRKPPQDKGVRDVLEFPRIKSREAYPTEKPEPLLKTLMKQSSFEGDLIVDPFAGSGSTIHAALSIGREAYGFDIQPSTIQRFSQSSLLASL
jgi:site-specific DNA-methyltransferase (adenine-specific)